MSAPAACARLQAALVRLGEELSGRGVDLVVPEGVCDDLAEAGLTLWEIVSAVRQAARTGPGLLEVGCGELPDLVDDLPGFPSAPRLALFLLRFG